jgi:hypothetical protein
MQKMFSLEAQIVLMGIAPTVTRLDGKNSAAMIAASKKRLPVPRTKRWPAGTPQTDPLRYATCRCVLATVINTL